MSARDSGRPARWRQLVTDQGLRVLRTLRIGRAPSERPLPRVRLSLGAWVPGWVLRTAVGVVALACVGLFPHGTATEVLAVLGALVLVALPSGLAAAVFALTLGLRAAVASTTPFDGRSFLLLFGVHLLVELARVGGNLPWNARVDLRVLLFPVRRFLLVQAFAQLLALAAAALTSAAVTVAWLPVLSGVGLTLLAWLLLSRLVGPVARPRGRDGEVRSDR